jgi:hypothetical protein
MSAIAKYNFTSSDGATANFAVGTTVEVNGTTYVYCLSTAATIKAYAACSGASPAVVEEATTTTATALGTGGGFACVPQFAVGASEYFWAVVESLTGIAWDGSTTIKVFAENATAGALMYSTATDGNLDDASGGSTIPLIGLVLTATVTTAAATKFTTFRRLGWAK